MTGPSSIHKGKSPRFATTRWSLVLQAKGGSSPVADEALTDLCREYWYPLYLMFRRRSRDCHQAQDLTQSFFACLLEKDFLDSVDPIRGRFRAFLLSAAKHFLANEWDKKQAEKRGGGLRIVPLVLESFDWDSGESRFVAEPAHELSPERLFERQWAIALLDRVLTRLRKESHQAKKSIQFTVLQSFLALDQNSTDYNDVAEQLGTTVSAARVAVHRLRKRYRELLRDEISHTVATPEDIEDEIRYLFHILKTENSIRPCP